MPLTDLQCRSAKRKEKPYKLADSEGLYLEVMPSGSKQWRLKYRFNGKEKRIAIGKYPAVPLVEVRQQKTSIKEELKRSRWNGTRQIWIIGTPLRTDGLAPA